jgi:flagellar basal-body rod protein FlgG
MVRGLYTAYTGMEAQQQKMDVVSNNLANANTAGFKKDSVTMESFKEVLAIKINDPMNKSNTNIGSMTLGVAVDNIYTNFEQGALKHNEDPFSVAIEGKGMFVVGKMNDDGTINEKFTRDGSFTLNANNELVTKDGNYVVGQEGIITIPSGQFSVKENGAIYENNVMIDQLQIAAFEDYGTLRKIGDSLYDVTQQSVRTDFEGLARQGYEEASNVNSVKEMIDMISIMRSYEANQKVLTTYDETLDNVVNNVGRL